MHGSKATLLQEQDLVLERRVRRVGRAAHHGEVVEDGALGDGRGRLRDQLRAPHLAVPLCRVVDANLGALLRRLVGRVLERGVEVDVVRYALVAVDVPLVRPYLGGPRPWTRVRHVSGVDSEG
jgi:hypothetical protein